MRSLSLARPAWWRPWAATAVVALAIGYVFSSPARAAVVYYYPGTGMLTLDNNGADYSQTSGTPTLGSVQIYVAATSDLPATLDPLSDWTSQIVKGSSGDYMSWDFIQAEQSTDALAQGVYNLAKLPANLPPSAFGYYYHSNIPPPNGVTYSHGPADSSGAVEFGNIQGGALAPDIVYLQRVVPSQNTWTGPVNGSWNTAGNWSLSHAASSSETASFTNTSLAGTVTLDHNQSAGSLWFDSSRPLYHRGGLRRLHADPRQYGDDLDRRRTARDLRALALTSGGSLTVDAEPAGNVAPPARG